MQGVSETGDDSIFAHWYLSHTLSRLSITAHFTLQARWYSRIEAGANEETGTVEVEVGAYYIDEEETL